MNKQYDYIIVGAGFAGASLANILAKENKKILIIEKRNHIGGNSYDCYDKNNVLIHLYGPHIFHTYYEEVFEFLKQFGEFEKYEHKVLGNIDGKLVPIPFNFKSLEIMLPKQEKIIKEKLLLRYEKDSRVSIFDLLNDDDKVIKEFGRYVFDKVFAYYTAKQWGVSVNQIDTSVINRVPVVLGYNDLYFADTYQYMPKNGFTSLFENMLKSENIDVRLSTKANDVLKLEDGMIYFEDELFTGKVIYTGEIDELFSYKFGKLKYRSLDLKFETINKTNYQQGSVINYLTSEKFTRITEFKYLTNQHLNGVTTILKEYPLPSSDTTEAYYPIFKKENVEQYEQYANLAKEYKNLYMLGRLAEYKYYNMDVVIKKAMDLAQLLLSEK